MLFAPVSWLCEPDNVPRLASWWTGPTMPPAFPDISSDRQRRARLQLRGSAGFTPASHLCLR